MKHQVWLQTVDLDAINTSNIGTLADLLGIRFTEVSQDSLVATMPVSSKTLQPMGIMHGGASCVLAETVGSVAANLCVDLEKKACVGLEININHIRPIRSGMLTATATPLHIGKTTQVWDIKIRNQEQKLVSISRLTVSVIDWKKE